MAGEKMCPRGWIVVGEKVGQGRRCSYETSWAQGGDGVGEKTFPPTIAIQ